ncbi:MAG: hypothetical protein CMG74_08380 [Candidatus Marinimicrobia bacterium]|nr:hypothetical protein [Candidatus Neomarinimicrobiota bacterium]|tara:strand:- start:116 stop:397 length:282 start_codon:yes stop_codon:yes gene_type:complete
MFIFDDGYIVSLSASGKIFTNIPDNTNPPAIIEEWGFLPWTEIMMEKVLERKLIGVRVNGTNRYIEYEKNIHRLQNRWKKMLVKYPDIHILKE